MKKTLIISVLSALSILISCSKEENPSKPIVFSAKIAEQCDTKVSVNCSTGKVSWVKGDQITINNGTNDGVYEAETDGPSTTFKYVSGTQFTAAGTYSATYGTVPTSGVVQAFNQTPGSLIHMTAPGVTTSGSATEANFVFTADCGLLKLSLTCANKSVRRIYVSDGTNTFQLYCETAQSINSGADFYIALPVGTYTKYIIRNSDNEDAVKTVKTGREGTVIANNQINTVSFNHLEFNKPIYTEGNYSGFGININNTWWAPVNCGYEETDYPYGKLYQWGRYNGCGYGAAWTNLSSQSVTAESVIQITASGEQVTSTNLEDPSKFYCDIKSSGKYDWKLPQESNRWSTDSPTSITITTAKKTANDPCPDGWRVPTYKQLDDLSLYRLSSPGFSSGNGTIKGLTFSYGQGEQMFLPASGYRNDKGTAMNRMSYGAYWSSTAIYGGSSTKYYSGRGVTISGDKGPSFWDTYAQMALSIRCVLE